jgi:hypothetical protein
LSFRGGTARCALVLVLRAGEERVGCLAQAIGAHRFTLRASRSNTDTAFETGRVALFDIEHYRPAGTDIF